LANFTKLESSDISMDELWMGEKYGHKRIIGTDWIQWACHCQLREVDYGGLGLLNVKMMQTVSSNVWRSQSLHIAWASVQCGGTWQSGLCQKGFWVSHRVLLKIF